MGWRGGTLVVILAALAAGPMQPAGAQLGAGCVVRGYGIDSEREGEPTNMRTRRNQPCWFNMRFGAEGLMLTALPGHGRVEVHGARITYTPAPNYLGPDRFALESRGYMSSSGRRRPTMRFTVSVLVTR